MYPDTDLPPLRITPERLRIAGNQVPKPVWELEESYRKLQIPDDLIAPLALSPFRNLFETAVEEWGIPPSEAAVTLVQFPKRISRKLRTPVVFPEATLRELLTALRDRILTREGMLPVLEAVALGKSFAPDALPPCCSDREVAEVIDRCSAVLATHPPRDPAQFKTVLMGMVMNQVRGRIEGRAVAHRIGLVTPEVHHD